MSTVWPEGQTAQERLDAVLRHIANVRDRCVLIGERLIEQRRVVLGMAVIANGQVHDNSKLRGIEWLYMHEDVKVSQPELFKAAVHQHVSTNKHHPEAWPDGIKDMSPEFLAEMVADWAARASEFGSSLDEWVKGKAMNKFGFTAKCRVYKDIRYFMDVLLERKFK